MVEPHFCLDDQQLHWGCAPWVTPPSTFGVCFFWVRFISFWGLHVNPNLTLPGQAFGASIALSITGVMAICKAVGDIAMAS
jgi:hypothetical protein